MTPPLKGLRVVELTTMITGSLAGVILADLGADVIKVEQPDGGDPFRSFKGGLYSPHFCSYNRNKRSIVLDLHSDSGTAAIQNLIARCDVLLDNFRPGVLDRLQLSEEQIRAIKPNIIHCSITGFGPTGPYASRPAYDSVAQALGGMSSLFVDPDDPLITGPTLADNITAYTAAQGILAAIFGRDRGRPVHRVEVNMIDATIAFMPDPFGQLHQLHVVTDRRMRGRDSQSFAFACSDGKLIAVHLSSREKFWNIFVEALGLHDLASDPRFSDRHVRTDNYEDLREALNPRFRTRSRSEWLKFFADVDLPVAPIYDVSEVGNDPHVRHLGTFHTLKHPTQGLISAIRRPIWLNGSRNDQPMVAPPVLGEHTEEILNELEQPLPKATASS